MPPAGTIVILEDNPARIEAMQSHLSRLFREPPTVYITANAHTLLAWLPGHLWETSLISLDHDLPLRSESNPFDHGDGRMIADYLATLPPTCPVIVHSSNDTCATGMFYALHQAGWPVFRVMPYDGEVWISQAWITQIQQCREAGWIAF